MDVTEAIRTRRSVRKYSARPVEQEKLDKVLEAARISPSAANDQNWHFIVVCDEEKKKLLFKASFEQPWVDEAPCAIVVCGTWRRVMDCGQPTDVVNPSIAMSYMMLAAHEQGLGTCWLGHFKADEVKQALGIPEDVTVLTFTPLGYPAETPVMRPRKEIGEIVSYDKY